MSWYKIAQNNGDNIVFQSYSSYGDLHVLIKGKPYKYVQVSPYQAEILQKYIKFKNWRAAFPLVQSFIQEKDILPETPNKQLELGF